MSVRLVIPQGFLEPKWMSVDLGNGVTFEVAVKRPDLVDQLQALQDAGDLPYSLYRLRSHIIDWRGVEGEDGQPAPFSWLNLRGLCAVFPHAVFALIDVVRDATAVTPEGQLKNSQPPCVNSGTANETETPVMTVQSTPIVNSDDSIISERQPD